MANRIRLIFVVLLIILKPNFILYASETESNGNTFKSPNNSRTSVVIATGNTHMNIPVDRIPYSYSQSIYYSEEIGIEGQSIDCISWFKQDNYTFKAANLTIYMGHTQANEFTDDSQWLELSDMTQVFDGFIPATNSYGWLDIALDIPFDYDSTQNLVIAVFKNGLPSNYEYYGKLAASTSSNTRTIVTSNESSTVDLTQPISYYQLVAAYPNIKLSFSYPSIASRLVASPTICNFHDVHIGLEPVIKTITFCSKGLIPFIINQQPTISGNDYQDFAIINDTNIYPVTLNYNENIEFKLAFNPSVIGTKNASLLIDNNLNEQTLEFPITGIVYHSDDNYNMNSATLLTLPVENEIFLLMPSGDTDYYLLENLCINDTLFVSANNVSIYDLHPSLTIKDSSGLSIAENSSNDSEIEVVIPATGNYYLKVNHLEGNYLGMYELNCYYKRLAQYTPPENLQVSSRHNHIEISWEEPNNDFDCVGYYLYRNGRLYSNDYFPPTSTSFLDYDVLYTNDYSYQLVAIYANPEGYSMPTSTITITYYPDSEPVLSESFEDNPDFSLQVENWIQYDLDESPTLGLDNVTFENQYLPMSYMVFNPSLTIPLTSDFTALTGNKMIASFPSEISPNDDWLISPRIISSGMSLISFFAKSYSQDSSLAKIRIRYSLGGSNIEDFNYSYHPTQDYLEVPSEWTRYDFISTPFSGVPIRYAIQNVTSDNAILLIDDFTFFSEADATYNTDSAAITPNLLLQNYPNPFNPQTTISFNLRNSGHVILEIYNIKGQKVKTLLNDYKVSGRQEVVWNGNDDNNNSVSSGVYFYKIRSGKYSSTKKMILMK